MSRIGGRLERGLNTSFKSLGVRYHLQALYVLAVSVSECALSSELLLCAAKS